MISATPKTLDQILAQRATDRSLELPQTTAVEKAAQILDSVKVPARQAPRRLPVGLSVENL